MHSNVYAVYARGSLSVTCEVAILNTTRALGYVAMMRDMYKLKPNEILHSFMHYCYIHTIINDEISL